MRRDGPGVISAAVGNPSDTDAVISFAVQGGEAPVQTTVPARGTANLSVDGPKVSIAKVPAAPGAVGPSVGWSIARRRR